MNPAGIDPCPMKPNEATMPPEYQLGYARGGLICHQRSVVYVQLQQTEVSSPDTPLLEPEMCNICSFCKVLTASDRSTHGGFSVLRRHADECLPPLDMSQNPAWQELVAKNLHGNDWHFRHIFRGQPRRHLLTTGWSVFVAQRDWEPAMHISF